MRQIVLGVFAILLGTLACRAEDDPPPDPRFQPMTFIFQDGVIKAIGAIEADTDDVFRNFLIEQGKLGEQWNVPMLMRSPGGALETALKVGHMIRDHQMSTVTDDLCASACTYMFMGGVKRVAAKGTLYGVHQFYNDSALKEPDKPVYSANDLIRKQKLIADMQEYVLDMGVNPAIIALASKTSPVAGQDNPDGVLFLTRKQIVAYKVENVPTSEPEGQPIESLSIPGVFPEQGRQIVLEPLPQTAQPIVLGDLKGALSIGLVRRLFAAHEGSADDVSRFVAENFAEVSKYYGLEYDKAGLTRVKLDFVNRWPLRHYMLDENAMSATCNDLELTCDVSGTLNFELGTSANTVAERGRSSYHFQIFSPGDNPRITVEEGQMLQ